MEQYLVFDIETSPIDWNSLAESQQEYLLRRAETDADIEQKKYEMALSPMTGQVVTIGMQLMQASEEGGWELLNRAALQVNPTFDDNYSEEFTISHDDRCIMSSERRVLTTFWNILKKYNRAALISFNGRNFDAPFLMLRSALHRIKPSRNLMAGTKFNYSLHYDLIDELTFFQASSYGATRRFNFDFYTRQFGITSPKSEGVDGSMVGTMFKEGKYQEIAEYCMRDINATWELFLVWYNYLKY